MKIETAEVDHNSLSQNVEKLLNVTAGDRNAILKHYNVSPKELQEIINSIRAWYEKEQHLPQGKLDDQMIIQSLIFKGFRIEEVKDKIDNSMSAKHKMPEILLNRDPFAPDVVKYLQLGFFVILPKKTPSNHRVSIFRRIVVSRRAPYLKSLTFLIQRWRKREQHLKYLKRIKSPTDVVAVDCVKFAFMMLDYRTRNDVSLGEQWIFDLTNVTFQNAVQMTPALLTKIIYYLRFCFGSKIKGIHFINMPPFATPIINIVKKLMKPKVAKRINVSNNFDDLCQLFPRSILPIEYGGDEISCEEITEEWLKIMQSDAWRQYFSEQDKVISDETKRTRFLSSDDFFGCEGSFRKLEVD